MNNLIDNLIKNAIPTVFVPIHGDLPKMDGVCNFRYLCAGDGIWIEADLPWIYLRMPIAVQNVMRLPHGTLKSEYRLKPPGFSHELIQRFINDARADLYSEFAGVITMLDQRFKYKLLSRLPSTPDGIIRYERPNLEPDEVVVCDLHSNGKSQPHHGHLAAGIQNDVMLKINAAIGQIHRDAPEIRYGLYVNGMVTNLAVPAGHGPSVG